MADNHATNDDGPDRDNAAAGAASKPKKPRRTTRTREQLLADGVRDLVTDHTGDEVGAIGNTSGVDARRKYIPLLELDGVLVRRGKKWLGVPAHVDQWFRRSWSRGGK